MAEKKRNIGKICPFCHTVIKPLAETVSCPSCDTLHHKDCWSENGGCTTYGCIRLGLANKTACNEKVANKKRTTSIVEWVIGILVAPVIILALAGPLAMMFEFGVNILRSTWWIILFFIILGFLATKK